MTTLLSILSIPELLNKVLVLSGTVSMMELIELYGYSWKEYSMKERRRQNILSMILCLSREIRVYALRWTNPFGLSEVSKNRLVQRMFLEDVVSMSTSSSEDSFESSDDGVSMDSDSEMFTDSE